MHKKFEINQTKIRGGCQSGRKVVTHNSNSKSDLPLVKCQPEEGIVGGQKIEKLVNAGWYLNLRTQYYQNSKLYIDEV